MTERYVLDLEELDAAQVALAGGKGANLGELSRIEGVRVPAGFCVTTDAFRRVMAAVPGIDDRLDRLSRLDPDDRQAIRALSAEIRRAIEGIAIPDDLAAAITRSVTRLGGAQAACAVRSSATAEDLPTASFAGQQDTYLNVAGPDAVLEHVSRCWASLFTERAVTYRLRNGFDHRKVQMAVVVQRMVFPQAAGILFTADPVTSNRKVVSIEAELRPRRGPGVRPGEPGHLPGAGRRDRRRAVAARSSRSGSRWRHAGAAIEPARQEQPALTDAQVVRLAGLAGGSRRTSASRRTSNGAWPTTSSRSCRAGRSPRCSPFRRPAIEGNHVYVSVGHQQMMTDAMKPLGLSVWLLTTPAPMTEAGGRLFVDVTKMLGSPATRAGLLQAMGKVDPLIGDALRTVLDRGDFIPAPGARPGAPAGARPATAPSPIETDPAIPAGLTRQARRPTPR